MPITPQPKGYSLVFPGASVGVPGSAFHFSPSPDRIDHQRRALTTLVELPQAIYRESHGEGIQSVTLEGTTGQRARLYNGRELTGRQAYKLLDDSIGDYWARLAKDQSLRVEYHDYQRDKHYFAEIMTFDTPQGAENRLHDRYNIGLKLYAKIEQKIKAPTADKIQVARSAFDTLTKVKAFIKKIGKAGRAIADMAAKASEILNQYVLQPISDLTTALGDFAAGVTDLVAFPLRALSRITGGITSFFSAVGSIATETLTTLANALRQARRSVNRLARFGDLFKPTVEAANDFVKAGSEFISPIDGTSIADELGILTQTDSPDRPSYTGVRLAKVRKGDTLARLALREMGSASRWHDIASLNSIDDSASLADLSEVLIPVSATTPNSAIGGDVTDTRYSTPERLYGRDIQVVQTSRGKLSMVIGPDNDIATVGGEGNLMQAIMLKTRIAQGTLLEEPAYGLRPMIGKPQSAEEEALAVWGLRVAAESDPRIESARVERDTASNISRFSYYLNPIGASGARPINTIVEGV